jgi:hypothetical protein
MNIGTMSGQTAKSNMNASDGHSCLWAKARNLVLSFIREKSSMYDDIVVCVRNTFLQVQTVTLVPRELQRNASAPARFVCDEVKEDGGCLEEINPPSSQSTIQVTPPAEAEAEAESNDALSAGFVCMEEIPSTSVDVDVRVEACCFSKELEKGQHLVSKENEDNVFEWNVDLRLKNTTYRCGFQRKLSLNIGGCEVPFVFHIDPIAKELIADEAPIGNRGRGNKKQQTLSTFRRPGTKANLWIKCLDRDALPAGSWPVSVSISGGGLTHIVSAFHDFALECNCRAPFLSKLWDIPFDIPEDGTWMVSAHLRPITGVQEPAQNSTFDCKVDEGTFSITDDTCAIKNANNQPLPQNTLDAFKCGISPIVKHTFIHFPLSAPSLARVFTTPASVP